MVLEYYKTYGDYAMEQTKPYWIWGIVVTVAAAAIRPASLLIARQKFYEVFLSLHHLLVVLFLVGFYWRIARMVRQGVRTAVVAPLHTTDGEYLRIEIQGVHTHGVVYLCFPTLSWMFWKNHPFPAASSLAAGHIQAQPNATMRPATPDPEKSVPEPKEQILILCPDASTAASAKYRADKHQSVSKSTTFIVRSLTGVTARLAARVAASGSPLRIPVWLDGSYHSNVTAVLSNCTSLICIAGRVGVTDVLPVLRSFHVPPRARLIWGVRKQGPVEGIAPEMSQLSKNISVSVFVGKPMHIAQILSEGLAGEGEKGPVGIVVCGPPGMADEVRARISELGRSGACRRSFEFVDEAFSC